MNVVYVPRDYLIVREQQVPNPAQPRQHHHSSFRARLGITTSKQAAIHDPTRRFSNSSIQHTICDRRLSRRASVAAFGIRVLHLGGNKGPENKPQTNVFGLHRKNREADLRRKHECQRQETLRERPKLPKTYTSYEGARQGPGRERFRRTISGPVRNVPVPHHDVVATHGERVEAWRKRDLIARGRKTVAETWRKRSSLKPYQRLSMYKERTRARISGTHGGNTLAKPMPERVAHQILGQADIVGSAEVADQPVAHSMDLQKAAKPQPPVRPPRWTRLTRMIPVDWVQTLQAEQGDITRMHEDINRGRSGPKDSRTNTGVHQSRQRQGSDVRRKPTTRTRERQRSRSHQDAHKDIGRGRSNSRHSVKKTSNPRQSAVLRDKPLHRQEKQSADSQDFTRMLPTQQVSHPLNVPVLESRRRSRSVHDLQSAMPLQQAAYRRTTPRRHSGSEPPHSISNAAESSIEFKTAQIQPTKQRSFSPHERGLYLKARNIGRSQPLDVADATSQPPPVGHDSAAGATTGLRSKRKSASVQDLSLSTLLRSAHESVKNAANRQVMRSNVDMTKYHLAATSSKVHLPTELIHPAMRAEPFSKTTPPPPPPLNDKPLCRDASMSKLHGAPAALHRDHSALSLRGVSATLRRDPSASTLREGPPKLRVTPPSTHLQPTIYKPASPAPDKIFRQQFHALYDPPSTTEQKQLIESINLTRRLAGAEPVQPSTTVSKVAQHFAAFSLKSLAPPEPERNGPSQRRARNPEPRATQVIQAPNEMLKGGLSAPTVLLVSPPNLGTLACGEKWASGKAKRHKHVVRGQRPGKHRYTVLPDFAMNGMSDSGSEYSQDADDEIGHKTGHRSSTTDCDCFEHDAWQTVVDKRWSVVGVGKARDGRWVVKFVAVPRDIGQAPSVRSREQHKSATRRRDRRASTTAGMNSLQRVSGRRRSAERGSGRGQFSGEWAAVQPKALNIRKAMSVVSVDSGEGEGEDGYYDIDDILDIVDS